jgi:hypothetical protein
MNTKMMMAIQPTVVGVVRRVRGLATVREADMERDGLRERVKVRSAVGRIG